MGRTKSPQEGGGCKVYMCIPDDDEDVSNAASCLTELIASCVSFNIAEMKVKYKMLSIFYCGDENEKKNGQNIPCKSLNLLA